VRRTARGSSWIPGGAYPVTGARGIGAVTQGSSRLCWGARWQGGRAGLGNARLSRLRLCWGRLLVMVDSLLSWVSPTACGAPCPPARACNPSGEGQPRTPRRSAAFVGQTPGFTPGHPAHRQRPLTHRGDTPPVNVIDRTELELRHEVKPGDADEPDQPTLIADKHHALQSLREAGFHPLGGETLRRASRGAHARWRPLAGVSGNRLPWQAARAGP
jgi:hypothetical protein